MHLELARRDDGRLDAGGDRAGVATSLLDVVDGRHGLLVSDLTEDDVLAVEPASGLCRDEELRAIATHY